MNKKIIRKEVLSRSFTIMEDSFLSISEASIFLKVTKSTLYAWVHQRCIPHRKHGGKLVFSRSDLLEWSEGKKIQILGDPGLGAV